MNELQKRLNRLDRKVKKDKPENPEFIGWKGNPWTPEQMAEALRRNPEQTRFLRALPQTPATTARRMADPTADLCGQPTPDDLDRLESERTETVQ